MTELGCRRIAWPQSQSKIAGTRHAAVHREHPMQRPPRTGEDSVLKVTCPLPAGCREQTLFRRFFITRDHKAPAGVSVFTVFAAIHVLRPLHTHIFCLSSVRARLLLAFGAMSWLSL